MATIWHNDAFPTWSQLVTDSPIQSCGGSPADPGNLGNSQCPRSHKSGSAGHKTGAAFSTGGKWNQICMHRFPDNLSVDSEILPQRVQTAASSCTAHFRPVSRSKGFCLSSRHTPASSPSILKLKTSHRSRSFRNRDGAAKRQRGPVLHCGSCHIQVQSSRKGRHDVVCKAQHSAGRG